MAEKKYPLSFIIRAFDKSTGALRAWNAKVRKLTQPIRVPLTRLGNRLGALSQEAGLPRLVESFKGVGTALGKVNKEVFALGKKFLAMGAVATAVFFGITRSAVDAGDELAEMADRLGVTVDWFAQTRFAAEQADVPAEKFNDAMDTLSKRLGEAKAGGGPLLAFLNKVSPTLARQVRSASSTEEAFTLMVDAIEKVQDPARRAALGSAAFGRGAKQMSAFAGLGRKAIDAYRARFEQVAGSQERFARGAGDLDNAMRETQVAFLGLRNAAAGELFPALTELARAVTGLVAGNREGLAGWARRAGAALTAWVKGGGVQRLADGLGRLLKLGMRLLDSLGGWPTALAAVAAVMAGPLLSAVGGLISALVTLGAAIGATPVGWLLAGLAAIVALAVLVWRNFDSIKKVAAPAFAPVVPVLRNLWSQLQRLWAVLAPVLLPALRAVGKVLGAVLIIQLNQAGKVLASVVDLVAKWVGLMADLASWAVTAGTAIADAFGLAWEKVKPIAEVLQKLATLSLSPTTAIAQGASALFGAGASLTGSAAAPTTRSLGGGGETRVVVDFSNMPRGARVTADPQGTAPMDLSVGYSMLTP